MRGERLTSLVQISPPQKKKKKSLVYSKNQFADCRDFLPRILFHYIFRSFVILLWNLSFLNLRKFFWRLGGACLSPLVQVLLDRLAVPLIINLFQNRDFDETFLERLKTVLLTVNAVISDAEELKITNLAVKDCVNELKDAIYDADEKKKKFSMLDLFLIQSSNVETIFFFNF